MNAQQRVRALRDLISDKFSSPPVLDAWCWLVTEVGEAGVTEAALHELGDVFLMLCTLATGLGIDLQVAYRYWMHFPDKPPPLPSYTHAGFWISLARSVAILGDSLLRLGWGSMEYTRNNHRGPDTLFEIGQVYYDLSALAIKVGVDLDIALDERIRHFKEKYSEDNRIR